MLWHFIMHSQRWRRCAPSLRRQPIRSPGARQDISGVVEDFLKYFFEGQSKCTTL